MGLSSATIKLSCNATVTGVSDLATVQEVYAINSTLGTFSYGTGSNAFQTIFSDKRVLTSGQSETLDLYDFAGATSGVGEAYTLARIKGLLIKNHATAAGSTITVGNEGSAAAWNSLFNASDTGAITIQPDSDFSITTKSAAGWLVADSTNHLLKVTNAAIGSTTYDIYVLGANA